MQCKKSEAVETEQRHAVATPPSFFWLCALTGGGGGGGSRGGGGGASRSAPTGFSRPSQGSWPMV